MEIEQKRYNKVNIFNQNPRNRLRMRDEKDESLKTLEEDVSAIAWVSSSSRSWIELQEEVLILSCAHGLREREGRFLRSRPLEGEDGEEEKGEEDKFI